MAKVSEEPTEDQATDVDLPRQTPVTPPEPLPIGGWLYLPAIGLALAPIGLFISMFMGYEMIGRFAPGETGKPWFAACMVLDVTTIALLLATAVTFYSKYAITRWLFPGVLVWNMVASALSTELAADGLGIRAEHTGAAKAGFALLIWGPYFIRSKRVKQTFTKTFFDVVITSVPHQPDSLPSPVRTSNGNPLSRIILGLVWRYPHLGWRRVSIVVGLLGAMIGWAVAAEETDDGGSLFLAACGAYIFAIIAVCGSVEVFNWIKAGFRESQ